MRTMFRSGLLTASIAICLISGGAKGVLGFTAVDHGQTITNWGEECA